MSAPMSMEEWQSRLRQEKQKERQNKNKSAEILHSYRGGIKDEDEIQKKLRLAEQQKKKESQQYLHSYKTNVDEIENMALSPKNNKKPGFDCPLPPVVGAPMKDDPRTSIAEGAVSSIAANFSTAQRIDSSVSPPSFNKEGSVPDLKDERNGFGNFFSENNEMTMSSETGNSQSTNDTGHDWVDVTSEEAAINTSSSTGHVTTLQVTGVSSPPVLLSSMDTSSGGNRNVTEQTKGHPRYVLAADDGVHVSRPQPDVDRLNVDFSFGLISMKIQPSLDSYMLAVKDVVTAALNESPTMNEHVNYNPSYTPYVEDLHKDEAYVDCGGRPNVQRLLVRAVVPVFVSKEISPRKARSFIIKALAAALRQGQFLELAEQD